MGICCSTCSIETSYCTDTADDITAGNVYEEVVSETDEEFAEGEEGETSEAGEEGVVDEAEVSEET